ncbi:alpha/beta fold hydrolase [Salegentibacter sp.]|uniref:bifunctional alpha/beta hydrolase/OsmC family protein n=1 Tax=Salegentibacter sp. TaxID=1903072 RepID=UPI003568EA85
MKTKKVKFKNKNGEELMGYLELPLNQDPHNFVLFAHCFTCNKNFFAAKNISRSLASAGYGVLRFDFTGLGESEGDFSDTNFSGNIQDLVAAAEFLKEEHQAPGLLVGHSLGGAAVLYAAKQIASVKAVATVAAPSTIKHVEGLLRSNIDEIEKSGIASVNIGGRSFDVKKQFLDDIRQHDLSTYLNDLKRALLILHSPQDPIVGIKNAEELYVAAKHPKSFISIDGASHLMEAEDDAVYAGEMIATWAKRYLPIEEEVPLESESDVVANLGSSGYTTQMKAGKHHFISDEPIKVGGKDFGPTPYQLVSAGLAACTSMTLHMYARRKKWLLENVETHVSYSREHASDCESCEDKDAKIDTFKREIVIKGELDEKQKKRLMEIADKCPVHKSLTTQNHIPTSLKN